MNEVSVLIGGKAGDGINSAGAMVAQLLNHLGYRIYLYFDYPSLIRGGHNFAIVRGREIATGTCGTMVDFVLALNQETVERHRDAWKTDTAVIFNADLVKATGQGISGKGDPCCGTCPGDHGKFGDHRRVCKGCRDPVEDRGGGILIPYPERN